MKIQGNEGPTVLPETVRPVYRDSSSGNALAFGAGKARGQEDLGAGIADAGKSAFSIGKMHQDLLNETMAKDADVAASKVLLDLQYNPETGYMAKKGKNAVEGYQDALKASEDVRQQALDNLPNDQAKKMFDQVFLRRLQYSMEGMASHASREGLTWMKDSSEAREANLVAEGVLNWNDLDRFKNTTIPAVVSEVVSRAQMMGTGDDQRNFMVQRAVDSAHIQRLKAMVPYNPKGAIEQLADIKGQLSGTGQIMAEETIMHGVRLAHEQQGWTEHAALKQRQENDEKISQDFFSKFVNTQLDFNTIDQSTLSAPMKAHWYSMVNAQSRQGDKLEQNNPQTIAELVRRISLPYGDENKITDITPIYGYVGKGVSLSASQTLIKMVIDQRTPEGQRLSEARNRAFLNFRPQFVHDSASGPDLQGGKDFFEFQQAVMMREDTLRNEKKDPHQVYDPTSPSYIGNMVDTYKATFRERIQRQIDALRPRARPPGLGGSPAPVSPRKEGETIDDYLKRASGR